MARPVNEPMTQADRSVFGEAPAAALPASTFDPRLQFAWARRSAFLERYGALTARVLLAQIFLLSGMMKIVEWSGNEALMARHGMILIPYLLAAATAVELAGGLAVLLGFKARLAALMLFLYLIPTTLIFHGYWRYVGEEQQMQMFNFLKNLAIMGGLMMVLTFGSGMCSIDGWLHRPRQQTS